MLLSLRTNCPLDGKVSLCKSRRINRTVACRNLRLAGSNNAVVIAIAYESVGLRGVTAHYNLRALREHSLALSAFHHRRRAAVPSHCNGRTYHHTTVQRVRQKAVAG